MIFNWKALKVLAAMGVAVTLPEINSSEFLFTFIVRCGFCCVAYYLLDDVFK